MSWAPEVLVDEKWSRNQLRFATRQEAAANAEALYERWTLCIASRATESDDPVTHAYVDGVTVAFVTA